MSLKLGLSKSAKERAVASIKSISIREKILKILFGKNHRLTIIVPSESLEEIIIEESKRA